MYISLEVVSNHFTPGTCLAYRKFSFLLTSWSLFLVGRPTEALIESAPRPIQSISRNVREEAAAAQMLYHIDCRLSEQRSEAERIL